MAEGKTPALAVPAGRGRWVRLGLALLAGAVMTCGHPPVDLPWTLFLSLPVLVWLVAGAPGVTAAAWTGWAAGFGYFTTSLHWIGNAFLVDPDQFALLMPLGVVALPAGLAIFWAVAFGAAKRIWPGDLVRGALLLAAALTAVEAARSFVLTGFPWALPGYVWIGFPPMQAAAWVGPFGMTLLTLVLTALPLVAFAGRRWWVAGLAIAAGAGLWAAGAERLTTPTTYAPDAPVLRIVQPNAPEALKFKKGYALGFYRGALEATAAPPDPALGPADVVIWPETAVPFVIDEYPEQVARISAAAGGATVILGTLYREVSPAGDIRWMNSMATILPGGRLGPRYDKHHLVPFGEYLPLGNLLSGLGLSPFANGGGFVPGPGPRTLHLPGLPPFSALICYEAIFPWEVVAPGPRPAWMVQITNDAWFGEFAGPQQHYAQARIRAIEQGLPIVRSANTGISAVVDSLGREIVSLPLGRYGKIDAKLPEALPPTLYSRTGDAPALAVVAILLVVLFVMHARVVSD